MQHYENACLMWLFFPAALNLFFSKNYGQRKMELGKLASDCIQSKKRWTMLLRILGR